MDTYNMLNLYFNFIFNEGFISFRNIYKDFKQLELFKEWLSVYNIYLPFIHQIQKNECDLLYRSKGLYNYDKAFKTNYNEEYHKYIKQEKDKYQVVLLNGFDEEFYLDLKMKYDVNKIRLFVIDDVLKKDLSISMSYQFFLKALYQLDRWPGILVFKGKDCIFQPINSIEEIDYWFKLIEEDKIFNYQLNYDNDQYFIQLSDLHLGTKKTNNGLMVLNDSLDELYSLLDTKQQLKFLISGDLMNSPNRKNMYLASSFMNRLKRMYHGDVTFVLGNHDVIVHGLNLLKRQKTKVVAYLLGENIKVYHDLKMIVIKIDSTSQGNLARGMVGSKLLQEIEEELLSIGSLQEYTLVAMLHHHLTPIKKDTFLKIKWNEKWFVNKLADKTKALVDAREVIDWLEKHHVKYIFHGHKHIPCVFRLNNAYVMAGGASCGGETKERNSRYLSYNLLKYNRQENRFKYCFVFYDDITKQERHRVTVKIFEGE